MEGIKELGEIMKGGGISEKEDVIRNELGKIISETCKLMIDTEKVVRESLIKLFSYLFDNYFSGMIDEYLKLVIIHISNAMTHLRKDIRSNSLDFIDILLKHVQLNEFSEYLIENYLFLLQITSRTLNQQISSTSKPSFKSDSDHKLKKMKSNSQNLKLKILDSFLNFLKSFFQKRNEFFGISSLNRINVSNNIGSSDIIEFYFNCMKGGGEMRKGASLEASFSQFHANFNKKLNFDYFANQKIKKQQNYLRFGEIERKTGSGSASFDLHSGEKGKESGKGSGSRRKWCKLKNEAEIEEFLMEINPILIEYFLECSPSQLNINIQTNVSASAQNENLLILKSILNILAIIFKNIKSPLPSFYFLPSSSTPSFPTSNTASLSPSSSLPSPAGEFRERDLENSVKFQGIFDKLNKFVFVHFPFNDKMIAQSTGGGGGGLGGGGDRKKKNITNSLNKCISMIISKFFYFFTEENFHLLENLVDVIIYSLGNYENEKKENLAIYLNIFENFIFYMKNSIYAKHEVLLGLEKKIYLNFSEFYKKVSSNSEVKIVAVEFIGKIFNLKYKNQIEIEEKIEKEWILSFPKLLWKLKNKNEKVSALIFNILLDYSVNIKSPSSPSQSILDSLQSEFILFFHSTFKNQDVFGPFLTVSKEIQFKAVFLIFYFSKISVDLLNALVSCSKHSIFLLQRMQKGKVTTGEGSTQCLDLIIRILEIVSSKSVMGPQNETSVTIPQFISFLLNLLFSCTSCMNDNTSSPDTIAFTKSINDEILSWISCHLQSLPYSSNCYQIIGPIICYMIPRLTVVQRKYFLDLYSVSLLSALPNLHSDRTSYSIADVQSKLTAYVEGCLSSAEAVPVEHNNVVALFF